MSFRFSILTLLRLVTSHSICFDTDDRGYILEIEKPCIHNIADLPESQGSIDLFQCSQNGSDNLPQILPPRREKDIIKMLYDEVCSLRKDVKELKELLKQGGRTAPAFQIEGSNVKKPLTSLLKSLFFQFPWLSETDEGMKRKMSAVLEECGWEANGNMLVICFSFASHSFTNWRNQVRQKLVTSSKDVEMMPLRDLQRYLFSAFWLSPSETDVKKNFKLTLALRAFADGHKLFKKCSSATTIDFWRSFRKNFEAMLKQSLERWQSLEQKMVKKIQNANKED